MTPIALIAAGAVSAQGVGALAFDVGAVGAAARSCVKRDAELEALGLRRPQAARAELGPNLELDAQDRAQALLGFAAQNLGDELTQALPKWRERRVALVLGTSGGGLPSLETLLSRRAEGAEIGEGLARSAFYFGPLRILERALRVAFSEVSLVLAACASSTVALGLGSRWLEADRADLVIAGGFDALTPFIAAGFEALGATASAEPAPFRLAREGMALGEGAALCALCRADDAPREPLAYVLGFGASSDAVHVTAPDRSGGGLARAATLALGDANLQPAEIDLVSAHATSTPFNDAAEANAIGLALGAAAERVVVHPFKAVIGHTLGAAGALESLAACAALRAELMPAAVGSGAIEPNLQARLLERNTPGHAGFCLKLSSAFGGANAALVLGRYRPRHSRPRPRRAVHIRAIGRPRFELDAAQVAERLGRDELKVSRLDPVSQLALAACDSALTALDTKLPPDAGILIGTAAATLDVNETYHQKLRERGARGAEPRRFPPTSPNLAAGECSILLGLRGPCFALGAGPGSALEALLAAHDLLEAGDANALIVAAVEQVGPVASQVFAAAGYPVPPPGAVALIMEAGTAPEAAPVDRAKLLELHAEAVRGGGRLGAAEPGWPSLLEAVARLSNG